jgi:hypothetical protein
VGLAVKVPKAARLIRVPFIQAVRTEHYTYDPLRMKQIRELVDDFEAGNLDLQEKSYANA